MGPATTHTELSRRLTSRQISMIGLAGALGTGLFLGSGATIAHGGPATIVSYLLAGLLALAVVWALAEMVVAHPEPGGYGAVAARYWGHFGGYLTRWNFAVVMLVAVGAEVTAASTYLQYWFPGLPLAVGTALCSLLIVSLNLITVRLYGASEYWFSMIKVVAIIVFILFGFSVIFRGTATTAPTGFSNLVDYGGFAPMGVAGIVAATALAVFSFGGIENVSVAAAESANPARDVPRAARNMIWRLLVFYLLAILVVLAMQPWPETASADGTLATSPFVKALALLGIPAGADIMNGVLIVAALSAANGCLYASSRMIHSLAMDGYAVRAASQTARNGAPRVAVLIAASGMVAASLLSLLSPNGAFMVLYGCATAGILVTWSTVMWTHLKFQKGLARQGRDRPAHRLWFAPALNWIVMLSCLAIFVVLYFVLPIVWWAGVPYIIVLTASYYLVERVRG